MSKNDDALRCHTREFAQEHAPLLAKEISALCEQVITKGMAGVLETACELKAENEALRRTAPLCEKHQPKGGTRSNCVICAGEHMQAALSRISYACGEPNEMEVSSYDVHFNEGAVVEQVQKLRAENEAQAALLRGVLLDHWATGTINPELLAAIRQHLEGKS